MFSVAFKFPQFIGNRFPAILNTPEQMNVLQIKGDL